MNPEIDIKIELIPIIKQDKRTGALVAHFEPFPRAMASGSTEEEAKKELMEIFALMLQEQEQDITREIVERYFAQAPIKSQKLKDVRIHAYA